MKKSSKKPRGTVALNVNVSGGAFRSNFAQLCPYEKHRKSLAKNKMNIVRESNYTMYISIQKRHRKHWWVGTCLLNWQTIDQACQGSVSNFLLTGPFIENVTYSFKGTVSRKITGVKSGINW